MTTTYKGVTFTMEQNEIRYPRYKWETADGMADVVMTWFILFTIVYMAAQIIRWAV